MKIQTNLAQKELSVSPILDKINIESFFGEIILEDDSKRLKNERGFADQGRCKD